MVADLNLLWAKLDQKRTQDKKEYRKKWLEENSDRIKQKRKLYQRAYTMRKYQTDLKPFIGVDGEGAGEGLTHIYWLLRVGEHALWYEDGRELQSIEILKWLADLGMAGINEKFIPVSFFFDYDTTMILRHLPRRNLEELMYDKPVCVRSNCKHPKAWHMSGYKNCVNPECKCGMYLRGGETTIFLDNQVNDNYIRVRVQHRQLKVAWANSPFFTITDVADLFQTSFVKTLEKWQKGEDGEEDLCSDEVLERIRVNKERRSSFKIGFDIETFDYNKLECELLEKLMTRFRAMCYEHGIYPDMWTGPGRLAEDLFKTENVPPRVALDIPPIINTLGDIAYFGGRAEGIHFGEHKNVISYDIASAYPHAYTKLPCLLKEHGSWEQVSFEEVEKKNLEHTLIVGQFKVIVDPLEEPPLICGLPMRDKRGNITFPTEAYGAWWYPEVRETIKLYKKEGIKYVSEIEACFTWRQKCEDIPGNFTEKWFDKRVLVGKSTRGIPIKLTLNSLYGKAAQKVGAAKWGNTVWAGLLTAYTRARLLAATIDIGSRNIISYQTDGIFCTNDALVYSRDHVRLGEWEREEYQELFLIQSGVYSAVDKNGKRLNKTRGMRAFEFEASYEEIKAAWYKDRWFGSFELPDRNTFVTVKLGLSWNKPELIGTWIQSKRKLSFKSNIDKREVWDRYGNPTIDGTTFAPGPIHRIQNKIQYGPHPFNGKFSDARLPPINDKFSYPYNRDLAIKLNEENRNKTTKYSYIAPDEPYIIEE